MRTAADVNDADGVAVAGDAGDDAALDAAGVAARAVANEVHDDARTRSPGDDIAQDAADSRWPRRDTARPNAGCEQVADV